MSKPNNMRKIRGKSLIKLGFVRVNVSAEESGDSAFHYYVFEIGSLCLISCANDECVNGSYTVEFFNENDAVLFDDLIMLGILIDVLNACKK